MWDDMSAEERSPSGSLAIFSFLLRSLAPFASMHVQRLYAKLHLNVDSISPAMTANGAVTDDALKLVLFFRGLDSQVIQGCLKQRNETRILIKKRIKITCVCRSVLFGIRDVKLTICLVFFTYNRTRTFVDDTERRVARFLS